MPDKPYGSHKMESRQAARASSPPGSDQVQAGPGPHWQAAASGCASDGFRANSAWPSPSRVYLLSLSPLAGGGLQSPVQSQPEAVQRLCRSRPRHTTQALRLQGPHRVQSRHAGSHPLPPPPKGLAPNLNPPSSSPPHPSARVSGPGRVQPEGPSIQANCDSVTNRCRT